MTIVLLSDIHGNLVVLDAVLHDIAAKGYRAQHCRVDYDRSAVIDRLNAIKHPGRAYLIEHF